MGESDSIDESSPPDSIPVTLKLEFELRIGLESKEIEEVEESGDLMVGLGFGLGFDWDFFGEVFEVEP